MVEDPSGRLAARRQSFGQHPLHKALGIRLESSGEGKATVSMASSQLTIGGVGGSVHGGLLALLVDVVMLEAIVTILDPATDQPAGTADLNITYMRPALGATVFAEATVLRKGRQLAVVEVEIKDDEVTTSAELGDNVSLFSLISDANGALIVGTGGEKGQIFRINRGGKPQPIFEAEGVQYIWALLQTSDGNIYAATGPNGQLFEIRPDGSHAVLFDSDESNLLCLLSDGKDLLFAGLQPGSYSLYLWSESFSNAGKREGDGASGKAELRISRENVEVPVTIRPSVELRGRIVAAEGARLPAASKSICPPMWQHRPRSTGTLRMICSVCRSIALPSKRKRARRSSPRNADQSVSEPSSGASPSSSSVEGSSAGVASGGE